MDGMWRVIDSGAGGAAWNMAVDEALLISAGKDNFRPTLRFFAWDRPSLSIGSFQDVSELDLGRLGERGIPLVRRPTGGRAVLHDAELTYSVTCPISSPCFPSDLMGSYKTIGGCFLRGLSLLGVEAALVPVCKGPDRKKSPPTGGGNPLCFSSRSWYEVVLGGKKLIGSAQRRLRESFLQQGSLLMRLDVEGLVSLLKFEDEDARKRAKSALEGKMTALAEHKAGLTLDALKGALVSGFQGEMQAEFTPGELTDEENGLALRLLDEKYAREEWNIDRAP